MIGPILPVPLATVPQVTVPTPHAPLATAHLAIDLQVVRPAVAHPVATAVAVVLVAAGFHQVPSAVVSVVRFPAAVVAYRVADVTP